MLAATANGGLLLIFLPESRHSVDTGGLCGSETFGQTSVSHCEKLHRQSATMQMFDDQKNKKKSLSNESGRGYKTATVLLHSEC